MYCALCNKLLTECKCDWVNDVPQDSMLKWFEYEHLPPSLQGVSKWFHFLAHEIVSYVQPGAERTVALRKLLEAKDAAVRATVHPGG